MKTLCRLKEVKRKQTAVYFLYSTLQRDGTYLDGALSTFSSYNIMHKYNIITQFRHLSKQAHLNLARAQTQAGKEALCDPKLEQHAHSTPLPHAH